MSKTLKCILLDDEIPGLTYLKMLCEQIPELEIVKVFNDPQKCIDEIPNLDFDLCISDIEMPGMDGLTLAGNLQHKLIIFITAYKEYAAAAFDIDAVDYITKPVQKERLQKAVRKALDQSKRISGTKKAIHLNTDRGKAILYTDTIALIRTAANDSRDKEALLTNDKLLVLKNINFTLLLKELPEKEFIRVNKKEIIALSAIKFFSHNEITLTLLKKDGKPVTVSLSETYRSEFISKVKK